MRFDFGSDNTTGMAPSALQALVAANAGFARAYGADETSARAADLIRQTLDADAEVRFVFSGTAANAIGLSMLPLHEKITVPSLPGPCRTSSPDCVSGAGSPVKR